ncbi:hypothetical protein N7925_35780 [Streptomyces sp. CA-278952]|uniref:hypothetical protein n=1 Tax=unclassified Streptomyces TaxID=2593676 RepID=UPI00236742F8|nr:hypothetical protein [Streptomyces sp. CA-278952]WDG33310.1 hypothetical protein N7925_35780 [Streptomyces sp. CA-278952]
MKTARPGSGGSRSPRHCSGPVRSGPSPDPEEFLHALNSLTGYFVRNPTCRAVTTGRLEADAERVVDRFTDGLVCRPDAWIADHIHTLVGRP